MGSARGSVGDSDGGVVVITNTKVISKVDTVTLLELERTLDPTTSAWWRVNRELTRRDWFWINSEDEDSDA